MKTRWKRRRLPLNVYTGERIVWSASRRDEEDEWRRYALCHNCQWYRPQKGSTMQNGKLEWGVGICGVFPPTNGNNPAYVDENATCSLFETKHHRENPKYDWDELRFAIERRIAAAENMRRRKK